MVRSRLSSRATAAASSDSLTAGKVAVASAGSTGRAAGGRGTALGARGAPSRRMPPLVAGGAGLVLRGREGRDAGGAPREAKKPHRGTTGAPPGPQPGAA